MSDARTAIVTGASSGIGEATARALAGLGMRVVLAARRRERLAQLAAELERAGAAVLVQPTDVRREADVLALFDATRARFGGVDVLVNNAGLGLAAPIASGETERWRTMLEVNVLGLCIASREAIRDMQRRGVAGHVVHVSSMAGHRVPGIESAVYSGTKFAVRAIAEGMRQELRAMRSPIRVSCVSPGYVETEFAEVFSGSKEAAQQTYARLKVLEARDVAEAIRWIVTQPPHVEVHDILVRPTDQRN
ncbi:MAG TPA: SDR family NAD(P)-dependent oxidoreductase [Candidatus Limnocylindria bacterium]|nr:SDR family NAD(P)-dependent oxidoreductase [Candidatus Limnocylindria bacterium]